MLTSELRQKAIETAKPEMGNKRVAAILLVRVQTGMSLKDCKAYIDDLDRRTDSAGKCIMGQFALTVGDMRAMRTADRIDFLHQREDQRTFKGYAGIIRCSKSYSDTQLRLDPYLTSRKVEVNIPVCSIMKIGNGVYSQHSDIGSDLGIEESNLMLRSLHGQVYIDKHTSILNDQLEVFLELVKAGDIVTMYWTYGDRWYGVPMGSYGNLFSDTLHIHIRRPCKRHHKTFMLTLAARTDLDRPETGSRMINDYGVMDSR